MALPNIDINAGTPPLLWSNVQESFEKINENFIALDLATGGTAVDLSNLFTDIIPASTQTYQLGDQLHRWKSVHTGTWSEVVGSELNGLWAGASQIKGYLDSSARNIIELPEGSTVAGNLIIDPDKTFFKAAQVDSELRIEADEFSDTLNLLSGTAMQLVVDSSGESIQFNNTGVTAATAGSGIIVSAATGNITITNDGVRSLQSTTALPSGRTTGSGINISATNGDNIRITNTGVLNLTAGNAAINISSDSATGVFDISYVAGVLAPVSGFTTIAILGDDPSNVLQSDSTADTLTFAQGYGIILTNDPTTDKMTVAVNNRIDIIGSVFSDSSTLLVDGTGGRIPAEVVQGTFTGNVVGNVVGNLTGNTNGYHTGDIKGSVFGDDSSILVDAVSNYIYGNVSATTLRTIETKIALGQLAGQTNQDSDGIAIGYNAGNTNQSNSIALGFSAGSTNQDSYSIAIGNTAGQTSQGSTAVAIGRVAGNHNQGTQAIAIGAGAGFTNQGINAIAIGQNAGYTNQSINSIVLNASGSTLDAAAAGLFISPIRASTTSARPIVYDTSTKELKYTSTLEFVNSTISTSDSSGITVDVITTFNSNVVVENDLNVTQQISVQGSRVINLAELKSVAAASIDFADFQARIAALV